MSDTEWDITTAALTIPCARCEATVGQTCRTITDHPTDPHACRTGPLQQAFGMGYYTRGQHDTAERGE